METAQHFFLAAARVRLQLSRAAGDHGGGELGTEREASVSPRTLRLQPVLPLPPGGTLSLRTLAHQTAPPARSCRADTETPSRTPRPWTPAHAEEPGGGRRATRDKLS